MPGVVAVPVGVQQAIRLGHSLIEAGDGLYALLDGPLNRPVEDTAVVGIHAEDETSVDHDAETVQPSDRGVDGLESDEETSQPGVGCFLEQTGLEYGLDGPGCLPQAAHASHALEQPGGEAGPAGSAAGRPVYAP